jgi:hypothetical protein
VFEKLTRGSLSGEVDGRAMIAKASIPPPRTDDRADERRRVAMKAEATAGLLKHALRANVVEALARRTCPMVHPSIPETGPHHQTLGSNV